MFFQEISEIEKVAEKVGCAIFVLPKDEKVEIRNALTLAPEGKSIITIDQVRDVLPQLATRQTESRFIVIRPADKLGEEAENAILKNLEEPQENVHFVLITDNLSGLLPTILSRAAIYIWEGSRGDLKEIRADAKIKEQAKKILTVKADGLTELAEELTKKKEGVRAYVLEVLGVAIEMAYKSYFLTGKKAFVDKIPKLVAAYENIAQNGHIKLHLVADLT